MVKAATSPTVNKAMKQRVVVACAVVARSSSRALASKLAACSGWISYAKR